MTAMEDVLDLYACPEDPKRPVVCVDETSKQHLQEMRPPLPMAAGKPYRYDPEYKRNGVSNLFMISHPFWDFDTLRSPTNARALILRISVETSSTSIFQTQKRFSGFVIISIRISRLPCIKPLIDKKLIGSQKNLSFTIPRSTAVG